VQKCGFFSAYIFFRLFLNRKVTLVDLYTTLRFCRNWISFGSVVVFIFLCWLLKQNLYYTSPSSESKRFYYLELVFTDSYSDSNSFSLFLFPLHLITFRIFVKIFAYSLRHIQCTLFSLEPRQTSYPTPMILIQSDNNVYFYKFYFIFPAQMHNLNLQNLHP
jgi:hypothetical protein